MKMYYHPSSCFGGRRTTSLASMFVVLAALLSAAQPAAAQSACDADLDQDGTVGSTDLSAVINAWGPCAGCPEDLNGTGAVDGADLAILLGLWGSDCTPLPWATVIEEDPDPTVITDPALREAITDSGLPWRVRDNESQIEMLLVPPGSFEMGCSSSSQHACAADENPRHAVTLSNAIYVGRYEVTQAQWVGVMGANPSLFQGKKHPGSADRPVERVSWTAIQGFLKSTGLRLPTEAEWEYTYRAGSSTAFHAVPGFPSGTNDDARVGAIAWYGVNNGAVGSPSYGTKTVGLKAANALGFHDMSGNVWEWVGDWYSATYYASSPGVDPTGPSNGAFRVLRGGSWFASSTALRASVRLGYGPGVSTAQAGFRVARNP